MTSAKILIVSDSTIDSLLPMLEPQLSATVAPFGQVDRTLLDGDSACWEPEPDYALVWSRPEANISSFAALLSGDTVSMEEVLREVDVFVERLKIAATRVKGIFIPTWTLPHYVRGLGLLSLDADVGHAYVLMRMNLHLVEQLREVRNAFVLDSGRWLAAAGPTSTNPKLWHMGKIAFSPSVLQIAAADIKAAIQAIRGESRKAIILDLDGTLWGGIVGDEGWENLRLGGHDPIGESFVSFQESLRALSRRGIMLAIASKNTEEVALEAIRKHPEMVLGVDDFVGWRIDWNDKAQNIVDLADEMNIGLDAMVFIDDSPVERARVGSALPEVLVPEWPDNKMLFSRSLAELNCFDVSSLTGEDQSRTQMYAAEQKRKVAEQSIDSVSDYLDSLEMEIFCRRLNADNLARATQLLNKSNQMNISTRRMIATEFDVWSKEKGNHVLAFRVLDRFGDYGLTGLAGITIGEKAAFVCDFVASCRVFGRGVEETMLHAISALALAEGNSRLEAIYKPTARNMPCKDFFSRISADADEGVRGDGIKYTWNLSEPLELPRHLQYRSEAS